MRSSLRPGLTHRMSLTLDRGKMVPRLYPEAASFQAMPEVFATGFMVGLLEWTCIELLAPHLDPGEGSLGTHVDVSHAAASPAGFTVTVDAELERVEGRRVWFRVKAHDGVDLVSEGRHERAIVAWDRFVARVEKKAADHAVAARA